MDSLWKAASFNINSLRMRLPSLIDWLQAEQPDVICLQETKVQDKDFPADAITAAGYYPVYKGEKGKNGVAILCRQQPEETIIGPDGWGTAGEARLIAVRIGQFFIVNTYVPQGREPATDYFYYKLDWIRNMRSFFERHCSNTQDILWMGDFNVATSPSDVYDPKRLSGRVGYHPDEQEALKYVQEWGFIDVFRKHVPEQGHYTFWDYRIADAVNRGLGWRIDHIWATPSLASRSVNAWIDVALRRSAKPSDHAPIAAVFTVSDH